MIQCDLKQCAYLGDAVWELFVREICITKAKTQKAMHNFSTRYVNASFQAHLLECVVESFNDEEKELLRRGRNLKISINKKSNPKIHTLATSFEVLIGYLYLENKQRLNEIFELLKKELKF